MRRRGDPVEGPARAHGTHHTGIARGAYLVPEVAAVPRIGNILEITLRDIEKVLYFEAYLVTDPKDTELLKGELITDERLVELREQYGRDAFEYGIGAEAVRKLLSELDVDGECEQLREELREATSEAKRKKVAKRLKVMGRLP